MSEYLLTSGGKPVTTFDFDFPSHPIWFDFFRNTQKVVRVGNSHTTRELDSVGKRRTTPNVTFPGGSLLDKAKFVEVSERLASMKNRGYHHAIIQFGGNEADQESKVYPYHKFEGAQHIINNLSRQQRGVWDKKMDPCNTIYFYDFYGGDLKRRLDLFVGSFLCKLQEVVDMLGVGRVTLICPGPRMLRRVEPVKREGVSPWEEGERCNLVTYYLSHALKKHAAKYLEGREVVVVDPFAMLWGRDLRSEKTLFDLFVEKEARNAMNGRSYGAVHYADHVYEKVHEEIQKVVHEELQRVVCKQEGGGKDPASTTQGMA